MNRWEDLLAINSCQRAFEKKHQPHQDASFYVNENQKTTLQIVWDTETHSLVRMGELRLLLGDDTPVRSTPHLLSVGIHHDVALEMATQANDLRTISKPFFAVAEKPLTKSENLVVAMENKFSNLDEAFRKVMQTSRIGGIVTIAEAVDEVIEALQT